jgi:hypothetical protein
MSSRFIAAAFVGYFLILRKFLPISLEPEWFCTLALKSKPPDFLQESFLDSQYVISSLNRWGENETPHCLGASGSFRASLFHVGLQSDVTNSKKFKKNMRPSHGVILCDLDTEKKSNLEKKCLTESPFTKMTYHVRGCATFRLNELDSALSMA